MKEFTPVRVRIRRFLKQFLPTSLFSLISMVWQRLFARFFNTVHRNEVHYTELYLQQYPKEVQTGPFKGLQYVDSAVGSNYLHKLLGSYEAVLHPVVEEIIAKKFDTIIDIGSAEGYYLAGLGRALPNATLVGFELEQVGRDLTQSLAQKNNLTNKLILNGGATAENVVPYLTPKTLCICDCEGAEMDILRPDLFSAYKTVDMYVIELHDFLRAGIKSALIERYRETHDIDIVVFKMADASKYPFLATIPAAEQYDLLRERGCQEQEWLVLRRK